MPEPDNGLHPVFELSEESLYCFSVLGRALYTAQRFEQNVKAVARYLMLLESREHWPQGHEVDALLEKLAKRTASTGRSEKLMSERDLISPWGTAQLEQARNARNELAHQAVAFVESGSAHEWEQFMPRIRELVHDIASADALLCSIMHLANSGQPLGDRHLEGHVRCIESWVTEGSFADM